MENKKQMVVAVAVIRNEEGKVLAQKRVDPLVPDADGKWEFPGGLIEFGETPEEAAIRECKEETDCTIEIIRFLPFPYVGMWEKTNGQKFQAFVWFFEAKHIEGDPKPLDKKVSEIAWFTKEEALQLDALPNVRLVLEYIE